MKRLIITTLLMLLVFASGALAQEITDHDGVTHPRYDTAETDAANQELTRIEGELGPAEEQLATMTDGLNELDYESEEIWAVEEQVAELEAARNSAEENLATARLAAIQEAPAEGSEKEQLDAWRQDEAALTTLRGWAGYRIGSEMHEEVGAIQDQLDEHEAEIESREAALAEGQSQQSGGDEGGGAASGGGSGENMQRAGDLVNIIGTVIGIILALLLFLIPLLLFLIPVALILMFVFRRPFGRVLRDMHREGLRLNSWQGIGFLAAGIYYGIKGREDAEPDPEPYPGGGPTVGGPDEQHQGGGTSHRKTGPAKQPQQRGADFAEKLRNLEAIMHEKIVGQEEAVSEVSTAARRRFIGGFGGERPASFLFMGPTGVGKTEVANVLADELYGGKEEMIRLDMGEYKSEGDIARLTGAPAGYIGHDQSNPLTDKMYANQERVVLFDEIEKAHPKVWDILLGVLDAGRMTDGHGNTIPFEHATIVLTSNLLAEEIANAKMQGEEVDPRTLKDAMVQEGVKREIVNRVGRLVVFDPLTENDVKEIARRMLAKTTKQMQQTHGVEVSFSEDALALLGILGYEPENGSRPLRGVIEREVEDRLSDLIMDGKIGQGSAIEFDVRESNGEPELGIRPAKRARQ